MSPAGSTRLEDQFRQFLPSDLADGLLRQYVRLKNRAWGGDFEGVQEAGGKVAEHALRACQHLAQSTMVGLREEIRDFPAHLRRLEQLPASQAVDSVRVVIPRALATLYTLRNKRGGGHTASEVDPGSVDAALTERLADWVLAELLRLGSSLPIDQAEGAITSMMERQLPSVFSQGDYRRVLKSDLQPEEEIALLLYSQPAGATIPELLEWTGFPRTSLTRYLQRLEKSRLVRLQKHLNTKRVSLLPTGHKLVEDSGWLQPN